MRRNCHINMENGDLILGSVKMEDEGPYLCRRILKDRSVRDRVRQLNVYGEWTVQGWTDLHFDHLFSFLATIGKQV